MRNLLYISVFALTMLAAVPAQAQLRQDVRQQTQSASPRLYDAGASFSLNKLFSPSHFRMGHSYELSAGTMGGNGYSLGVYTNSLMWQFSDKFAARVDVGVAHSPFGNAPGGFMKEGPGQNNFKLFLQNAEIAYRPSENVQLHFSMRQSPYGVYHSPYGYSPYGSGYSARFEHGTQNVFWKDAR